MSDRKMHPAMRRAQRDRKNTKEQVEKLAEKKRDAAARETNAPVRKRTTKPKNPAAMVNRASQPQAKKVGKVPPKTGLTSKELQKQKQKRLTERQNKRNERSRSRSRSRSTTPRGSPYDDEVVVRTRKVKKPPEKFAEYKYVKKTKTAKQLMEEKKKNSSPKKQIDAEEYEKIKEARLRADKIAKTTSTVVKADTEIKKKIVRDKKTGKKKYKYVQQDPETFDEYWDKGDYKPETMDKVTDFDDAVNRRKIDSVMKRTGKQYGPNDKVKIGDDVKKVFTLEDLDPSRNEKKYKIPIVDVDNVDMMLSADVLKKSRRDVLLIGPSESTKDAIIDVIMESKMGQQDKVFDATIIEGDDEVPKGCICIYSDTVPIKPPSDDPDSTVEEEESSEDSFDVQHKERIQKVREKQRLEKEEKRKKERRNKNKKKVVIAKPEKEYVEAPYDLRKDYPTARFIFLTKASMTERVDIQKLHRNIASFVEFKRFKKEFINLHRYECLVIDQLNKKRLYRIEFE
jgi:hypothetical protein